MGKSLVQKVSCSPIQNHSGFKWGVYDILKHNHWRYIKRRLPHKTPLCIRTPTDKSNDTVPRPKKPSSVVISKDSSDSGEKTRKTHFEIKRSVKALVKALVLEDKTKRNSRHQRSYTYPVQSSSSPKEKELLSEVESSRKTSSKGDDRSRVSRTSMSPGVGSLNPLYLMPEESNNIDNTDGRKSDFEDKEFKKKGKSHEDDIWKVDTELRHIKEFSENEDDTSSPRQSKACLDALSLILMNRTFLLKVLHDPGSPLARHFQNQQSFSSKTVMKAGTSPSQGSNRDDHSSGFDSMVSSGSGYARKRGKNQVVIKRFKDLRQKIKHVIKENKTEKHRITMDAVLDKVPRKYGFSKDLRHDMFAHLKRSSATKKNNKAEGAKLKQRRRKTSSLCGSLDRYRQLYESSFQREAKDSDNSEKSKMEESENSSRPIEQEQDGLDNILEISEDHEPLDNAIDASVNPSFDVESSTSMIEAEQDREVSTLDESLEEIPEISEDHSQSSEHETLENAMDATVNPSFDAESSTSMMEAEQEIEESSGSVPTVQFHQNPYGFDISRGEEQDLHTETVSTSKQLDEFLDVEAQDKVKFKYVRDILEISGFNLPESLSMWQLDYQPLDPLVYEEVTSTGCMIQDPDCSTIQEEGGNCNHLLLFDLINEVLIELYERSYHYCPRALSSLCRIHSMPVGYSVLKEVWVRISCYLRYKPHDDEQSSDNIISKDLSGDEGWMDLQFESECVGIEVEDLIFEEILEQVLVSL